MPSPTDSEAERQNYQKGDVATEGPDGNADAPEADSDDMREPSDSLADEHSQELEPVNSSSREPQQHKEKKIPLMLRRLLPHNNAGRLDQ